MSTLISTTSNAANLNNNQDQSKRFSLVKWLENSQFDANNEYLGRLTSVPHSNIIDFDAEELKSGMEISVFKNGEIWKAQIIIPKTSSNTIDLPPSTHKKIRTKALASNKLNDSVDSDTSIINLNANSHTDDGNLNNCMDSNNNKTFADLNDFEDVTSLFTNLTETSSSPSTAAQISNNNETNSSNLNVSANTTDTIADSANNKNNSTNKEWQLLQTAINEAGLNDLYQTFSNDANITPSTSTTNGGVTENGHYNKYTVSDMNIETVLQMQCELLEQQKELKVIETDTLEQLRLLHINISRLAKKFDSFENIIALKSAKKRGVTENENNHVVNVVNDEQQSNILSANSPFDFEDDISPSSRLIARRRTSRNSRNTNTTDPKQQQVYSSPTSLVESISATVAYLNNSNDQEDRKPDLNTDGTLKTTTLKLTDTDDLIDNVDSLESNIEMEDNANDRIKGIQNQLALNRFLREQVKQRLGTDYLVNHAVSDIPVNIMKEIQKEAFNKYLPNDCRPIKAWCLAMASLRCLKRDLVKHKTKQLAAAASVSYNSTNDNIKTNETNQQSVNTKIITKRTTDVTTTTTKRK